MRSPIQLIVALVAITVLAGCSGARLASEAGTQGYLPVSGSASDTLPPPVVRREGETLAPVASVETDVEFVQTAGEAVPPAWSTPAPVGGTTYATGYPSPPPPPYGTATTTAPVTRYVAPAGTTYTAAPAAAATGLQSRCWSGCGLPCEDGISSWHARLVGGWPLYVGDDDPEPCSYWGVDLGRTHCGCWGYDVYYRMSGAKFDRQGYPDNITKDGGITHHLGGKLTWEKSFGSRFYFWTGLGAGYYWTDDYIEDSDGFEVYGELGLGYVLSETFRIRAGLNVHGADTDTGRLNYSDIGKGRWLWLIAPVVQLEVNF